MLAPQDFAARVLQDGPNPRQGKKSDQAHPPIHPTKHTTGLSGKEKQIYEFVVRHFLACCSKDAEGMETVVEIDIANEKFVASGLAIIARNYLDVYPYKKWEGREIHNYTLGQTFEPTSLEMAESETKAPDLLTEADLIALMEKHGIGTDATHADHIETIKSREYVGLRNDTHFMPSHLGMGLVEGYDSMGYPMSKPNLRAELESDLKCICEGTKEPAAVLAEQISKYREVFRRALEQARKIDEALGKYFNEQRHNAEENLGYNQNDEFLGLPQNSPVLPCNKCGAPMILKQRTGNSSGYYISCSRFPECRNAIWFPSNVLHVEVSQETCQHCGPQVNMLQLKFKPRSAMPLYPDDFIGCVGGCDDDLLNFLDIKTSRTGNALSQNIAPSQRSNMAPSIPNQTRDSGYQSNNSSRRMSHDMPNSQSFSIGGSNNASTRGNSRVPSDEASSIVCHCGQNAVKLTVRKVGPNTGRQFYKCQESQCDFFLWASDNEDRNADGEFPSDNWDGRGVGGETSWRGGGSGGGMSWRGGGSGGGSGERGSYSGRGGNDNRWGGGAVMSANTSASGINFSQQNQITANVNCNCGEPAKRLTVQKEGPNQGRQFYSCPKPRNEQCGFFSWADDNGEVNDGNRWNSTSTRGRGSNWPYPSRGMGQGGRGQSRGRGDTSRNKRKCGLCRQEGHTRNSCPQNNL